MRLICLKLDTFPHKNDSISFSDAEFAAKVVSLTQILLKRCESLLNLSQWDALAAKLVELDQLGHSLGQSIQIRALMIKIMMHSRMGDVKQSISHLGTLHTTLEACKNSMGNELKQLHLMGYILSGMVHKRSNSAKSGKFFAEGLKLLDAEYHAPYQMAARLSWLDDMRIVSLLNLAEISQLEANFDQSLQVVSTHIASSTSLQACL